MTHQDDLNLDYKAASQEQPSEQTDQLILQAAADAIEADNVNSSKNKVIKGKFSARRWQIPASIAAAAVLTVSFVSTMNPWDVSVFDNNSHPAASKSVTTNLAKEEKAAYKMKADGRADKQVLRSRQTTRKQNLGRAEPEIMTDLSQRAKPAIIAEPAKLAEPVYSTEVVAESRITDTNAAPLKKEFLDSSSAKEQPQTKDLEADFEDIKPMTELSADKLAVAEMKSLDLQPALVESNTAVTSTGFLTIDEQLKVIEQQLQENRFKLAQAEIKTLLKQHPLDSFSEQQLVRFETIQQQLKLTQ